MKSVIVIASAVVGLMVGVAPAGAYVPAVAHPVVLRVAGAGDRHLTVSPQLSVLSLQPRSHVSTADAIRQSAANKTVKMWSALIGDGGSSYRISMVGSNPTTIDPHPVTKIRTYLVNVTIVNNGTDVYSPTTPDPCDPAGVSPETRVLNSPIFKNHAYTPGGTSISPNPDQYLDAFQREEFWASANPSGSTPGYHVKLSNPLNPGGQTQVYDVSVSVSGGTEVPTACGSVLEIPLSDWDAYMQSDSGMFGQLIGTGIGPTTLPVFLLHNVVFNNGSATSCCILGYHNAFSFPAQTYVVADYDTSEGFPTAPDIAPLTRAIGGWMDDPLANNPTSPWGHVGQVTDCRSDYEVGDPLQGTTIPIKMHHFTYHPQELAFFSWFFHRSPSSGVNGWYSNNNTFTTQAAACS